MDKAFTGGKRGWKGGDGASGREKVRRREERKGGRKKEKEGEKERNGGGSRKKRRGRKNEGKRSEQQPLPLLDVTHKMSGAVPS